MPTLLLSSGLQPEADELAAVAERTSWDVRWINSVADATDFPDEDCAFYGDTVAGTLLGNSPQFALIEPTFDLLTRIPHRYTGRQIEHGILADARRKSEPVFVKSADACNKCLSPRVWENGAAIQCHDGTPLTTPVLISEPVAWLVEYRLIILEREVVTFSPYMRCGVRANVFGESWPHDGEEVNKILSGCHNLLADRALSIPPAVTLDVGLIENLGWAVVEFNPVWCSRLYACDRGRMLPVLRRACLKRERLDGADRRWVISRRH